MEIGFGGEPVALAAIAIPLTRRDILPARFLVQTRDGDGAWSEFASFGAVEQRIDGWRLGEIEVLTGPGRIE
jgi:hypothetical protein